jgi:hypothetical protein
MISAEDLKAQLAAICDNLWWSSEADYPVEVFWQLSASPATPSKIKSLVQQLVGENIEMQTEGIEPFFAKAIARPSNQDTARLQQLKTLLIDGLDQPQSYRCGKVEVIVYVLGYASDGSIAGVKTTLVET